ncbi:GAP family protein [Amaricoccus solimangrovi]|uniref:GAP family protein n=1 Tax=Amaricoccus solimangrovi TaxID=2589815 RepID=A0A501WW15_9RHOB|nr:GAP family protein [Amaricoccus solimangrovi]TPE53618.1 GAP family protein [Amaricoccus solimangrovi]
MVGAIGDFLPLAMALALSPFPIIAIVMLLGRPDGGRAGTAFAIGWLGGLGAVTLLLVLVVGEIERTSLELGAGLRILLGLGLFAAAAGKWRGRPRGGAPAKLPGWAAALDRASPARAALVGAVLGGVNPKSLALAFAAAATIGERGLEGRRALLAGLVFVLLSSASVLAALILRRTGGAGGARRLEAVKRFMLRNNHVIMIVLLGVIGAKVLGDGLSALGG